jgi:hypothetical protein
MVAARQLMRKSLANFFVRYVYRISRSGLRVVRSGTGSLVRAFLTAVYAPNKILDFHFSRDISLYSATLGGSRYAVACIRFGQIYTNRANNISVLYRKTLIPKVSRQRLKRGPTLLPVDLSIENNPLLTRQLKISSRPKRIGGTVVSLLSGGGANDNYYHWLFDCLPRLKLVSESCLITDNAMFLVPNDRFAFQRYTLDFFNIPASRRLNSSQYRFIKASTLIATEDPNPSPASTPRWIAEFLRDSFLSSCAGNETFVDKKAIFLSRQDADRRRMINEDQLYESLRPLGVKKVLASSISLPDQVNLFSQASMIIGIHGAGLSNIVFSRPGTPVIEIFPSKYEFPYFSRIADICALPYVCFCGEPKRASDNLSDFVLRQETLRTLVECVKEQLRGCAL